MPSANKCTTFPPAVCFLKKKSFHMFNMFSNSLMRKLSIQASPFHLQKRFFYLHSWILTFHCPLPPHCWAPGQPWWSSPWLSWPHGTGAPTIETQQVELLEYRYASRTFVKSGNTDSPSSMKVKLITPKYELNPEHPVLCWESLSCLSNHIHVMTRFIKLND